MKDCGDVPMSTNSCILEDAGVAIAPSPSEMGATIARVLGETARLTGS